MILRNTESEAMRDVVPSRDGNEHQGTRKRKSRHYEEIFNQGAKLTTHKSRNQTAKKRRALHCLQEVFMQERK